MCEPTQYKKRFRFPTSAELAEFVSSFYDTDSSQRFNLSVKPTKVPAPGGQALAFDVELACSFEHSGSAAMALRLLESSLIEGYLCVWKGYLVELEEFIPKE